MTGPIVNSLFVASSAGLLGVDSLELFGGELCSAGLLATSSRDDLRGDPDGEGVGVPEIG